MGIQHIIHGLGGGGEGVGWGWGGVGWGGGIWVLNQILKIQVSGRLRMGTVNCGFSSRKNITNVQEI